MTSCIRHSWCEESRRFWGWGRVGGGASQSSCLRTLSEGDSCAGTVISYTWTRSGCSPPPTRALESSGELWRGLEREGASHSSALCVGPNIYLLAHRAGAGTEPGEFLHDQAQRRLCPQLGPRSRTMAGSGTSSSPGGLGSHGGILGSSLRPVTCEQSSAS